MNLSWNRIGGGITPAALPHHWTDYSLSGGPCFLTTPSFKTRFFSRHVRPGAQGNSVKPRVNLLPRWDEIRSWRALGLTTRKSSIL